jgi:hypothetical protein
LIDFIVFNATFNNISAISWRPVLVVEEAGGFSAMHAAVMNKKKDLFTRNQDNVFEWSDISTSELLFQ